MRDFNELRSTGLLWYLNRTSLHPNGLSLALHYDTPEVGTTSGWSLLKASDGLWTYPLEMDQEGRDRFTAFLKELNDVPKD